MARLARPGLAPRPTRLRLGLRLRSRAGPQRGSRPPPRLQPAPVDVTVCTRGRPHRGRVLQRPQVARTETRAVARTEGMFHGATCAATCLPATATRAVAIQVPASPPMGSAAGPSLQRLRPMAGAIEALVRSGSITIDLRSTRAREAVRSSSPSTPRWESRLPTGRCRRGSAMKRRRSSGGNIYTPNSLYKIPAFLEPDPGKS